MKGGSYIHDCEVQPRGHRGKQQGVRIGGCKVSIPHAVAQRVILPHAPNTPELQRPYPTSIGYPSCTLHISDPAPNHSVLHGLLPPLHFLSNHICNPPNPAPTLPGTAHALTTLLYLTSTSNSRCGPTTSSGGQPRRARHSSRRYKPPWWSACMWLTWQVATEGPHAMYSQEDGRRGGGEEAGRQGRPQVWRTSKWSCGLVGEKPHKASCWER